jgi:hypothetical protein
MRHARQLGEPKTLRRDEPLGTLSGIGFELG